MWLSPSLLKKDVKYWFQFRQSISLKEINKTVNMTSQRMWTRSPVLSYDCKQYICHWHSNHYFKMFHFKIYYACLLILKQLSHKSKSFQMNLYSQGNCRFNRKNIEAEMLKISFLVLVEKNFFWDHMSMLESGCLTDWLPYMSLTNSYPKVLICSFWWGGEVAKVYLKSRAGRI